MNSAREHVVTGFLDAEAPASRTPLRAAITAGWLADETELVNRLLAMAEVHTDDAQATVEQAVSWVQRVRQHPDRSSALDAFLREYDLSSEEGVLLMCLAEALLRIPDDRTAELLISDKLAEADWQAHLGHSDSLFVNAGTWGLMLTGRVVRLPSETRGDLSASLRRLFARSSEPVIRLAIRTAMRVMGEQFVMGRDIEGALARAVHRDERHSFDVLGEAAITREDADRYAERYRCAIDAVGAHAAAQSEKTPPRPWQSLPGISVKLSALHPRYEPHQCQRVLTELTPSLLALAQQAKGQGISLCVDAEEADRLELSLDVFEAVYRDPSLHGWEGFGVAVQAFQKRGMAVVEWLESLAREVGRRIPVRLVKGAYWDTEIKRAQEQGWSGYPVFTRKVNTDVCYLACARRLLAGRDVFYPQLATHNAHTIAAVRNFANDGRWPADSGFEFQRLHGMGEALYKVVREDVGTPCRVYAPVGPHQDLLPYLVRRLLENGANTSFVNRILDERLPPASVVADPRDAMRSLRVKSNPTIPLPPDLYSPVRRNSRGTNLADESAVNQLARDLSRVAAPARATSLLFGGEAVAGKEVVVTAPADRARSVGVWSPFDPACTSEVVAAANAAYARWSATPVPSRAKMLETAADQLEARQAEFIRLLILEAGKTAPDAIAEVREAVDYLRYYASEALRLLARPLPLVGPTGEHNEVQLHARGVFVCISPWNFPLAIFTGQIAAALVAGNPVIAKPAEQTSLIAVAMSRLLRDAGLPAGVYQCVLGEGNVGEALVADARVAGVLFTGSIEVAQKINRTLAARPGPIGILIAETGGQNAMIVDSSALPEQVVRDAIHSAFSSAGQRCSALRVLCLQEEIAEKTIRMLVGAMQELSVDDPALLRTDIGPLIDATAVERLRLHVEAMQAKGRLIAKASLSAECARGSFFAPLAIEIKSLSELTEEHFGPVLHVLRFPAKRIDALVEGINGLRFGLTLGIYSRIETTWRRLQALARVGNCYVNRGMTGAVVGVQPFGGEGLSGTGPKAGGPHYLLRLVVERSLSVNTAAIGGDARLLRQPME